MVTCYIPPMVKNKRHKKIRIKQFSHAVSVFTRSRVSYDTYT